MVAGLRLSCLVFSASKGATVGKPASVVVSTVLSVVLAVGMIPSSAFAAAGNASASAQAAQQAAPAGQPESNPSADADAVPTQGSASNPNSATSSAQSETAAEQPSPAASTPAIEPQLTADPAQIDVLACVSSSSCRQILHPGFGTIRKAAGRLVGGLPEHERMLHPLARPVEIDEPAVVHDAVDERGGELVVAEHDAPFGELDVGGYHQATLLVAVA